MKKSVLAIAAAVAFAALPLASCVLADNCSAQQQANCNHRWEERTKDPTCTDMGETYNFCGKCNATEHIKYLDVIPHDLHGNFEKLGNGCMSYASSMRCSMCDEFKRVSFADFAHEWDFGNATVEEDEHGCKTVTAACKTCEGVTLSRHMWDGEAISWYNSKKSEDGKRSLDYSKKCGKCSKTISIKYNVFDGGRVVREPADETDTALVAFISLTNNSDKNMSGSVIKLSYEEYQSYLAGNYTPWHVFHEYM